jgi:hypothetical protein
MKGHTALVLALGLLVGVVASACSTKRNTEQTKAITEAEQAKSITEMEQARVIANTERANAIVETEDAKAIIEKLGGKFTVDEKSSDKPLKSVDLARSKVDDVGLESLKGGLTNIQSLNLMTTETTDAGLKHLMGLSNLRSLDLTNTKVTDAGVEELQKALPNCKIER